MSGRGWVEISEISNPSLSSHCFGHRPPPPPFIPPSGALCLIYANTLTLGSSLSPHTRSDNIQQVFQEAVVGSIRTDCPMVARPLRRASSEGRENSVCLGCRCRERRESGERRGRATKCKASARSRERERSRVGKHALHVGSNNIGSSPSVAWQPRIEREILSYVCVHYYIIYGIPHTCLSVDALISFSLHPRAAFSSFLFLPEPRAQRES